jgi:hypothetical protein
MSLKGKVALVTESIPTAGVSTDLIDADGAAISAIFSHPDTR